MVENLILPSLCVVFASIVTWLTVRIVNRRERWAKWTAVGLLVVLPLAYIAGFGPACWIAATPRVAGRSDEPRIWMRVYFPIGALIHYARSQDSRAVQQCITCGARKGCRVIVPIDAGGKNWYGFTAE